MNKELEEAIKWLENNIKYYQEQTKFIETIDSDYYDEEYELYQKRIKIFKILLNYIENSIPKEVVKEKIEYIEDYFERLNGPDEDIEYIREKKQELLEGK